MKASKLDYRETKKKENVLPDGLLSFETIFLPQILFITIKIISVTRSYQVDTTINPLSRQRKEGISGGFSTLDQKKYVIEKGKQKQENLS